MHKRLSFIWVLVDVKKKPRHVIMAPRNIVLCLIIAQSFSVGKIEPSLTLSCITVLSIKGKKKNHLKYVTLYKDSEQMNTNT